MELVSDIVITPNDLLSGRLEAHGVQVTKIGHHEAYRVNIKQEVVDVSVAPDGACKFFIAEDVGLPFEFIAAMETEFDANCFPNLTGMDANGLAQFMTRYYPRDEADGDEDNSTREVFRGYRSGRQLIMKGPPEFKNLILGWINEFESEAKTKK